MWKQTVVFLFLAAALGSGAAAQRRSADDASAAASGEPAAILYRQTFDDSRLAFEATGYGSARFLARAQPNVTELARVEGFEVTRAQPGAMGSAAAMRIASTRARGATAQRYFDWSADDATIMFLYYAHGLDPQEGLMVQAWDVNSARNVHAYIPVRQSDQWQVARVPVNSMVAFGAGGLEAGDSLGNLMFVTSFSPGANNAYVLIDELVIFSGRDGAAPSAPPSDVQARLDRDGAVGLTWTAAKDDVGIYDYEIHRGASPDFVPTRKTRIGVTHALSWTDSTAPDDALCHYRVTAIDPGGHREAGPVVSVRTPPASDSTGAGGQPLEF